MKSGLKKREVFNEINITPLTDIFLVLLIIMMVVAPMLDTSGLKLAVPSVGPSEDTKEEPKVIKVLINQSGAYTVNEKNIDGRQLTSNLRDLKKEFPEGLIIETDPEASHEALTHAMDAAQTAGVEKIAVMQTPDEGASASPEQ